MATPSPTRQISKKEKKRREWYIIIFFFTGVFLCLALLLSDLEDWGVGVLLAVAVSVLVISRTAFIPPDSDYVPATPEVRHVPTTRQYFKRLYLVMSFWLCLFILADLLGQRHGLSPVTLL